MESERRWDPAAYHQASDVQEARAELLLGLLPLRGDETVLDAGCGSGRATLRLLERLPDGRVIAVDSNERMAEHARETLGDRATVIHSDLTELELEEPVDAIFSNAVFHWIQDHERLYERMYAALRPGGTLVAGFGATGNLDRIFAAAADAAREPEFEPHLTSYEPGWRFRGVEDTEALLSTAGFTDIEVSIDTVEETPSDPGGYLRTAPLLCYLELLPEELHDRFVEAVVARCPKPMTIDHKRLTVVARRPA
jgi:trans-aconitate 2-methyltransferase